MELTESYTLPVSQQRAWEALNDTTILRASIPGCDHIEVEQENVFALSMSLTVGPVKVHFKGRLRLTDIDAPRAYTIVFEGQGGTAGFGSGAAHITLEPADNGATKLSYTASAHMGGKLAQIGSRILGGAVRKIVGEFFRRFGEQVSGARTAPVADATADAAAQLHDSANRSANGDPVDEPQPEGKKSWTAWISKS
ncbi:carbon monoxide dehydrogenase subunit G [Paraburkholderia acidicola]|uniref:Carbon monoxide dehydrogenase subunit G n=1 Tax=Paraburkholderia acidicola TaxID=1912599 RepID=A0ABV1LPA4_9BURK